MRIAVDVGGTFTDVVAVAEDGAVTFVKAPSTPADQSLGVMDGLARLAQRMDRTLPELLAETTRIVHGMTVATNALLERTGARVGLLTTAGHRDVLEMREGLKPERYNLRLARIPPLVPRSLRIGIPERLRADGSVHTALDEAAVIKALRGFRRAGVDSVAVCYLHAWRDGRHEAQTRALIEAELPQAYVALSSEVLPQIKEYQRVSTTVINAYVGPLIRGYLHGLETRLAGVGYHGPLLIMLSHGGVGPVAEAVRVAAGTVLSGPAGGLAGARHVARALGTPDVVTLDMGGTSTDISLIVDGEAALATERGIATQTIALPGLDIVTLGAGGGSIGRTGSGGLLEVGPRSAGAVPGPASYGLGGTNVTVTDASVALGLLSPDNFLGGATRLDADAAMRVMSELGESLGVSPLAAAEGVHRVVNTHMAEGIRLATVRRGVDPRRFALMGFGGAAGVHITALASLLGMGRVLVPRAASVLSAWGMLATELRIELSRSHLAETGTLDMGTVAGVYDALVHQAESTMRGWTDGNVSIRRIAEMRYGEQVHEIAVELGDVDFAAASARDRIKAAFEARHEALYTYHLPDQSPVLVNARVSATGELSMPPEEKVSAGTETAAPTGQRDIHLGGWMSAPVFDFEQLAPDQVIDGPAVVESETTTVVLRPNDTARVTAERWLDVAVG